MGKRLEELPLGVMVGVREYAEGEDVELVVESTTGRLCIQALNEGGFNLTRVDLVDLLDWLEAQRNG